MSGGAEKWPLAFMHKELPQGLHSDTGWEEPALEDGAQ